ncbi:HD domain-containing protein [Halodesulfovibrio sp.]|jgi:putative hydrolase of HD superfamily|uniref:HD domain-containing protein n=1 Tax=Halodesulfovibrio sp. TaxID=1912772 RepID=UPI0025CCEBC8|nr:HD domain-containing protein [Halodesulfovibrio sp.]MCT4626017.1 HD domain-containing protein [Halodesulfovibrio sp.]
MSSIRKGLLQTVFSGAYMKRWNDKLRPAELYEVDKQAHKMIIAWLLLQENSRDMTAEERLVLGDRIVEWGIFDYLFRLVITDIKPPVYYRIKENPEHYRQLVAWVQGELEPVLSTLGADFWMRFLAYFDSDRKHELADDILAAAHCYASSWEFKLIEGLNAFDDELDEIRESFLDQQKEFQALKGFPELMNPKTHALGKLANLCGQLRFQKRWSQMPRIPETSVMGHMFLVGCYSYFFSVVQDACPARRQNNFFCGLFHDLPEMLTRDIISPVKKSVKELDVLIKAYEDEELERRVFQPLRDEGYTDIADRLGYFLGTETGSEFHDCIEQNGKVQRVTFDELQSIYNDNSVNPKDGEMLKVCDELAAYIEAYTAVRNGISINELNQAMWRLRDKYRKISIGNIHIGALMSDFD